MDAYVYPIIVNGQEILIIHDERLITWLNATDPSVKAGLYRYLNQHPAAGIMDLLNFCIRQDYACGLVFDSSNADLFTGLLS